MMYYFTADKWYGPLEMDKPTISNSKYWAHNGTKPDFELLRVANEMFSEHTKSLPSGPSLIPEFAGMVKEAGRDFIFDEICIGPDGCDCVINECKALKTIAVLRKTAVPVAEEKGIWVAISERMPEVIGTYTVRYANGHKEKVGYYPLPKQYFYHGTDNLNNYIIAWLDESAEEGKQTFSESDMIGFAYWVYKHCDYVCDSSGPEDFWGWETDTKDGFFSNNELLSEYLKTKQ